MVSQFTNCHTSLFADDTLLWSQHRSPEKALDNIKVYLQEVEKWACKWRSSFSAEKSAAVLFSKKRTERNLDKQHIHNQPIPFKKEFKFLGITFDNKVSWKPHVKLTVLEIHRRFNLLKILSNKKSQITRK